MPKTYNAPHALKRTFELAALSKGAIGVWFGLVVHNVTRTPNRGIEITPHLVDVAPALHTLGYRGLPKYRLNVAQFGKTDAPTIVFVHGGGGAWTNFRYQLEHFAKLGYRVVAYDANGSGHSDSRKCPSVLSHVNDLHALILTIHVKRPFVLVGHSDGAAIAQSYTAVHPERVRAVCLAGAYTRLTMRDKVFDAVLRLIPKTERFSKTVIQLVARRAFAQPGAEDAFLEENALPTPRHVDAWLASLENFRPPKKPPHVPALLVKGEKDQMTYQDQQRELQHAWHAHLVTIPNAGHVVQWEEPDAFNAVLEDFLKRHSITPAHRHYG